MLQRYAHEASKYLYFDWLTVLSYSVVLFSSMKKLGFVFNKF